MICRFCSQWNPNTAQRCGFCANRLDAAVDETGSGRATAAQRGLAGPPGEGPRLARDDGSPDPALAALHHDLERAGQVWKFVVGALAVVLGLLWAAGRWGC